MEKRKERTNKLATRSHERRYEWINGTLDMVASNLREGDHRKLDQAKQVAQGKFSDAYKRIIVNFLLAFHFGSLTNKCETPRETHSQKIEAQAQKRFMIATAPVKDNPIARPVGSDWKGKFSAQDVKFKLREPSKQYLMEPKRSSQLKRQVQLEPTETCSMQ